MHIVVKAMLLAATVANALPAHELNARATPHTLVPGLTYSGSTPPVRKEIRTLTPTELNIYYLGLELMQTLPISNLTSFYRVAGIHGTNYAWDGDRGGDFSDLSYGYCRHADPAFPTWHRPYVSLYEKTIHDLAKEAISKWPNSQQKTDHMNIIDNWRLPYWDWAADASIPSSMGSPATRGGAETENVQITKVDAKTGKFGTFSSHNPLFSYIFPKVDENGVDRIITTQNPSREPYHTSQSVRNPQVVNKYYVNRQQYTSDEMVEAGSSLKNYVFNMFSSVNDYTQMSNMRDGELSLEGVHGTVHITVGGLRSEGEIEGHMTDPAIAGFDPIFFLHHCNVDRLFALWQAINPNSYISTSGLPNANTELHPFRKAENSYWTSTNSRDVKSFGYTYPELIKGDVKSQVAALYRTDSPAKTVADASRIARKMKRSGFVKRQTQQSGDADNLHTPANPDDLAPIADRVVNSTTSAGEAKTYNEYVTKITAPNTAADGSYKVYVFLGEPNASDADWTKDNNFVGSFDVFAPSGMMAAHTKEIKGSVPLTTACLNLVATQKLTDMKPDTVKTYLKDNFVWKVTGQQTGTDATKIKIDVVTSKVTIPQGDNQLPQWGPYSHIYKAQ